MAILRIRDDKGNVTEIVAIKGDKGDPGEDGTMSFEDLTDEQKESLKGEDGYTPQKGVDYFDGKDGKDGYTPQKGVDYWTAADRNAMVSDVLDSLPTWEGGSY